MNIMYSFFLSLRGFLKLVPLNLQLQDLTFKVRNVVLVTQRNLLHLSGKLKYTRVKLQGENIKGHIKKQICFSSFVGLLIYSTLLTIFLKLFNAIKFALKLIYSSPTYN